MDRDSEQALVFAARRLQADGVAILFAARVGQFEPAALPQLRVESLSAAAVEALLADRAGTTVAPEVAREVASATGGNALAVGGTRLAPDASAARGPRPASPSIADVRRRRAAVR